MGLLNILSRKHLKYISKCIYFSQAISIKKILKRCKIKKTCFKNTRHKLPFKMNTSLIFFFKCKKVKMKRKSLPRETIFETKTLTCKPKIRIKNVDIFRLDKRFIQIQNEFELLSIKIRLHKGQFS